MTKVINANITSIKTLVILLFLSTHSLLSQAQLTPMDAGSKVHFTIKNFGIKTSGDLSGLKGSVKFDAQNPSACSFDVTVNSTTINTGNNTRDGHLKKEEYFDATKYPVIRMISTKIQGTNKPGRFQFTGNLTIKDVTKPVSFQFTAIKQGDGYLFKADDFTINRRDFKVGGSSVSMADELKVSLNVLAK